jgi:predicted ATP-dependent serine protease
MEKVRNSNETEYELYSSITEKKVDWLWYPYIPYGKISILQGDPGCGKSTFIMELISCVTTGKVFPNGQTIKPHNVIYQCSEDGISDTIKPRLTAAGANCNRVAYINEEMFGLTLDDEIVRNTIIKFKAKLLVVDPLQAYLGDADLSNASSIRRILRRLGLWASQYDCAIVLVGHLNKRSSLKELYRGLGSIDVAAAARSVLQIDVDEDNNTNRVVRHVKSSLAPKGNEMYFHITDQGSIAWDSVCESTFPACGEMEDREPTIKTEKQWKAALIIKEMLEKEPIESADIIKRMNELKISKRTAMKVKQILGIESRKIGQKWYWSLPETGCVEDGEEI